MKVEDSQSENPDAPFKAKKVEEFVSWQMDVNNITIIPMGGLLQETLAGPVW